MYTSIRTTTQFLMLSVVTILIPFQLQAELLKLDTDVGFDSVYLLNNPDASTITVALTVLAGEVDVSGPEGLSHYLEHLMFWHADNVDGQQIHARGGNAWVNGIITSYYNEGEAADFDNMLEFVRRLYEKPTLNKDFMIRERSVVAREYDLRVSENPGRRIRTKIRRDLYNNLALSRSVIGTPESIHSLTLAKAFELHKNFYHPGNSVLFLSGNLNKEEAEAAVNNHFAKIEPGSRHKADWRNARIKENSHTVKEFTDPQVKHNRLIYLALAEWPNRQTDIANWYTLWVLDSILDSALEGGIARPLRMDNFVLRSFDMDLRSYLADYFEFTLIAEPDRGVSLLQASTAVTETLGSLAKTGITKETLERVRGRLLQTQQRKNDSTDNHYARMSQQLSSGLSPVNSKQHLQNIENVSLTEVNDLLRALAQPKRRSVAHISPSEN